MSEFCKNYEVKEGKIVERLPLNCNCNCFEAFVHGKKGVVNITDKIMGNRCAECGHICEEL